MRWHSVVATLLFASACGRIGFGPADESATNDGRIPQGTAASSYASAVMADTPVAYFHFDENAGDPATSAVGAISAPYQGTFVYAADGAMPGSRSVTFDGASARIDLGDLLAFAGTAPYTIELWARPSLLDTTRFVIDSRTQAAPIEGYAIYVGNGYFLAERTAAGTESNYVNFTTPQTNTWLYYVVSFDGAHPTLYLDGAYFDKNLSATVTIGSGAGNFVIGDMSPGLFNKYAGNLDELAIYDHALSGSQIAAHYAAAQ